MCTTEYDITYRDFNPTVLFAIKGKKICDDVYHSHDFTEMAYIISGKGKFCINDRMYHVQEGDIIFINPGEKHQSIVTDPNAPTTEFYTGFTDFHFRDMEPNNFDIRRNIPIIHTDAELKQQVTKLSYAMLEEQENNMPGKYFMLKSYLTQMLLLIIREIIEPQKAQSGYNFTSSNKNYVVHRIMTYIDEHFTQKISLDQIAKNMYLSPVYISKIFKEETGDSPINYLIKIRMERAKDMLINPDETSVKNIATRVGYEDAYHFSKLFKKHYGVSPLNYKKIKCS